MFISNKKTIKNIAGFTLIELMISMAIIAILSGLYLANYRGANKKTQLNLATQKLASDIRLMQNYSLGLVDYKGNIPQGGWGIHFTKGENYYILFADLDNLYRSYENEEEYRRVDLPNGVTIDSLEVGNTSDVESNLDIIFLPPDPIVYINGIENTKAQIVLKNAENTISKINVNFFGLIDILD